MYCTNFLKSWRLKIAFGKILALLVLPKTMELLLLTEFDNGNLKLFSLTIVFFTCFQSNVGGESCGTCKPGFFNLQADNPQGCTPCFCNGVSDSCQSALLNRTQVNWDVDHVQIVITHAPTTFQATFQKYSYC